MPKTKSLELEQRRRQEIMWTVYRLLGERSWMEMTLDQIAAEAGVSKGLVTYYFKSKDEIIVETIKRYHAEQEATLREIVAEDRPFRERLLRLIEAAFPSRKSVEHEVRVQIEVWSYAKTHPDVWKSVAQSYRGFRKACESLIELGVKDGFVRTRDREFLYLHLHALVDGLTFQLALDRSIGVERIREELMRIIERLLHEGDPGDGGVNSL